MSNLKNHAAAVKAAIEISNKYAGKEMPAIQAERFASYANQAIGYKQLNTLEQQGANGEVSTVGGSEIKFRSESSKKQIENFRNYILDNVSTPVEKMWHNEGSVR